MIVGEGDGAARSDSSETAFFTLPGSRKCVIRPRAGAGRCRRWLEACLARLCGGHDGR